MAPFTAFATFPSHDALRSALVERGVPATLYQDGTSGGLLCVRVDLSSDTDEYAPHVLISTEEVVDQYGAISWSGCIYGVGAEEGAVYDTVIDVRQRAGDGPADTAANLVTILTLLRHGASAIDRSSSASRQHYIDTGRYLLQGEALSV